MASQPSSHHLQSGLASDEVLEYGQSPLYTLAGSPVTAVALYFGALKA